LVEYRSSEVAPIPAQAQDVKTAIRFLRKNKEKYRLKTEKIALWGDSSGAHTALLAGITGDDAPDTSAYGEESAQVACIVDWYAPVDMVEMCKSLSVQDHADPKGNFGMAIGGYSALDRPELAETARITGYLRREKPTPPILIMHGDRDHVVPFHQSCLLYQRLRQLGKSVEMYKVKGAFHAFGGFHSVEAQEIVLSFIQKHI
jgi:acetyl esterase/lipase